jgi:hypothetical protein
MEDDISVQLSSVKGEERLRLLVLYCVSVSVCVCGTVV